MQPEWKKVGVLSTFEQLSYRKETFRKARRGWENNITTYLKEIGINTRKWIDSTQDRGYWRALVGAVLNLRVL